MCRYEDDQDNGEWFLYTGSGGRDLTGNKRTNKQQSSEQTFDKSNLALKVSCMRGLPVRVVRSHKVRAHHSHSTCRPPCFLCFAYASAGEAVVVCPIRNGRAL